MYSGGWTLSMNSIAYNHPHFLRKCLKKITIFAQIYVGTKCQQIFNKLYKLFQFKKHVYRITKKSSPIIIIKINGNCQITLTIDIRSDMKKIDIPLLTAAKIDSILYVCDVRLKKLLFIRHKKGSSDYAYNICYTYTTFHLSSDFIFESNLLYRHSMI